MNNYTVIVVGARGSGKTVFLGSMFKKLSVAGENGFFLEAFGDQQQRLIQLYHSIAVGKEWPNATQMAQIDEWKFRCRVVASSGKIYDAFNVSYLDYSGGRITEVHENSEFFINLLAKADCLLGLIDGQRLFDFMSGQDEDGTFEFKDLPGVLAFLQKSPHPVHLVISKWDLLEGHFGLEEVRKKLFEISEFERLVVTKNRAKTPVRLIPISAVGKGFAHREANGVMKKSGKRPAPFQVEMPLALVLPDKMRAELQRIAEEEQRKRAIPINVQPHLTFWDRFKAAFGGGVRLVREYLPEKYHFTEKILEKMAARLEQSAQAKLAEAARTEKERWEEIHQSLSQVVDEKSALAHAVTSFMQLESELEYRFPSSTLKVPDRIAF